MASFPPVWGFCITTRATFNDLERRSRRYTLGNIRERSLKDLWEDPAYLDFRRRVREFQFAPCTKCGGCELVKSNVQDCYGNSFPTCGACLWAQGVVRCPLDSRAGFRAFFLHGFQQSGELRGKLPLVDKRVGSRVQRRQAVFLLVAEHYDPWIGAELVQR